MFYAEAETNKKTYISFECRRGWVCWDARAAAVYNRVPVVVCWPQAMQTKVFAYLTPFLAGVASLAVRWRP